MKKVIIQDLTPLVLVFLLPAGCRDMDVATNTYASLAEAQRAGAVDRGWIPAGLPAGAHELRAAHDPNSERRWGLFSFHSQDAAALQGLIASSEITLSGQRCDAPARIEWWPVLLRGDLDGDRIRATGLKAYKAKGSTLIFAVNWNQRRAYYWSQAASQVH